jgi:hypothetical protein|tara:strand:- start:309 stop:1073 length:765 start_codon:yes stop_codon:yes gene_type:complete
MDFVRDTFFPIKPKFIGPGIKINHDPPWFDESKDSVFNQTSNDIKFFYFGSVQSTGVDIHRIDTLLWRHWIVSYSIKHVMEFVKTDEHNFVECGVGDGFSAFFALREIKEKNLPAPKMHLFDSWGPMREEDLLENEIESKNRYSELKLTGTKNNLKEFEDLIIYYKGYIPEIFKQVPQPPSSIVYMHIDLNSTKPTMDCLEYFFPKLISGGVILFDDYGWSNHKDTKHAVDNFFKGKSGILMQLPTAQAIFFKN